MIAGDFPFVPMKVIQHVLSENNSLLFPTYLALDEIIEQAGERIPFNWAYKKRPSPMPSKYSEANIDESIRSADRSLERERGEVELMEELKAARIARRHARMEQQNFDEARSRGEIKECECCFGDFAENRLVHCNGDDIHVSIPQPHQLSLVLDGRGNRWGTLPHFLVALDQVLESLHPY